MKKERFLFCIIILSLFILSCGKRFNEPGEVDVKTFATEVGFKVDFQTIWNASKKVLSRYPIDKADSSRGLIETDWVSDRSDKYFSGYGEARVPYQIRYKVAANIGTDEKTGVTVVRLSIYEQYLQDIITKDDDFDGTIYEWYDVKSSTIKENYLLRLIEDEVRGGYEFQ